MFRRVDRDLVQSLDETMSSGQWAREASREPRRNDPHALSTGRAEPGSWMSPRVARALPAAIAPE